MNDIELNEFLANPREYTILCNENNILVCLELIEQVNPDYIICSTETNKLIQDYGKEDYKTTAELYSDKIDINTINKGLLGKYKNIWVLLQQELKNRILFDWIDPNLSYAPYVPIRLEKYDE